MLWHDSVTQDPGHRWLRDLVRTLFARPLPSGRHRGGAATARRPAR
jgi:hypothetical protein